MYLIWTLLCDFQQTNIEVDKWVKKSDLEILQKEAGLKIYGPDADDDDSDLENLHLYTVL